MSSAFRQHRAAKCAALAIAACALVEALAADESVGPYSGDCTLNNEPVHVDLEIVKNEGYQNGGDAILTISKRDGTSPVRLTMIGGYHDVRLPTRAAAHASPETTRKFGFRTIDVSEALGGRLAVQLTQEGAQLKGTLDFQPVRGRQSRDQAAVQAAQPASVPLVLTHSTPAKYKSKLAAQSQTPTALNPAEITGVYEGTLTASKRQFFAQLRVNREGANNLSALLSFSASASDTQPLGSFKLNGKIDPANSTFKLSSGGELTSSDGLMLAEADGDFDPGRGKIRAQLTPRGGTLELTRNEEKTAELQAKSNESAKRLSEGPVNLAEATTDDERRDAIVRWFSRLRAEYPDVDLHHTVLDELYPKVLNLFGDDDFVPVFGKPFDAMTLDDRNYVKYLFRRLFTQPNTRDLLDGFGDYLGKPFGSPTGSFSYADVAPQLAFRRTIRKQWHETMERLKSLSPASADYDELLSLEKKGKEPFHDLWPSEFKQFQEAVESTKHRLADGAATDRLNAAISGASGLDGARSLASWAEQQKELLEYVSENVRQQLNSRISAKIGEHIEPLLREEAEAVAALGDGVEAVNAGTKWYRHLHATYGFAAGNPAFQAALEPLKTRRSNDLAAAQLDIIAEIEKQSTERGVDNVKGSYFAVPGDSQTTTAAAVAQAVNERKKAIQREEALAHYSPQEQQWLRPDGTLAIPQNPPPPEEDDLRVAIVRTLEMMGGTRKAPFTVEWSNQITKIFNAYPIITINRVDKLGCLPAPGGWRVYYRVHMTIDYPDSLKRMMNSQPSFGGAMMQQLTRQINGPHGTQEGRFELTERGWWCPTMQEHGLGSSD